MIIGTANLQQKKGEPIHAFVELAGHKYLYNG